MTKPLPPTMLWESTDPHVTLTQRFHFATADAAQQWLVAAVADTYGITVTSVDRLVMSSYNLIAWLTTSAGPLLAKCCAFAEAHQHLLKCGELVHWLDQTGLPVSPPLVATTGAVQNRCDHLSVSVQRVISGELLEPTHAEQAHAAGVALARLHQALASYPQAALFAPSVSVPSLSIAVAERVTQEMAALTDAALVEGSKRLLKQIQRLETTLLSPQLVHGDYRAANVLWQADRIAAVLDFEEVRWGYQVNDLAWATVHLGTRYHDWGPVVRTVHQTFLRGYTTVTPLTAAEAAWLPLLLAWHTINLTNTATGHPAQAVGMETMTFYLDRADDGGALS
ncbi:MAG: phosphotransferase [Caldilineaceae bacterium]